MLLALHPVDFGVLGLYLLVMIQVGVFFSRGQRTSQEFLLAGRSMDALPLGLSITATLVTAIHCLSIPAISYHHGVAMLFAPLAMWITLPLVCGIVMPLYHNLRSGSIYEYLELRFDLPTRVAGCLLAVLWRLLWLIAILYAPCKAMIWAAGLAIPEWPLILTVGLTSTVYTAMGGMKAVIWSDVIQSFLIIVGAALVVAAIWWGLDGGAARVWEIAAGLGRTGPAAATVGEHDPWTLFGVLPHFVLTLLCFFVADQVTAQRYLAASTLAEAKRSFVVSCVFFSILAGALVYAGMALLAYYHDHPQRIHPRWVVNLDNHTRRSLTYQQRDALLVDESIATPQEQNGPNPLIPWNQLRQPMRASDARELISERRLLRPNNKQPFASLEEVILPGGASGEMVRWDINKLAMRTPPPAWGSLRRGEVVLHRMARRELLPQFVAEHLPWGVAGIILAGLLAASMSSLDSGFSSICTLLIVDFHRRLGWGRNWLAGRRNKQVSQLDASDEMVLARPLVLVVGVGVTLLALMIEGFGDLLDLMIASVNVLGGPLMAIFLLGIFSRRCTARGALVAVTVGVACSAWLTATFGQRFPVDTGWSEGRLTSPWPLAIGVAVTIVVGLLSSLAVGQRKSDQQLRGLVFGSGRLGERSES